MVVLAHVATSGDDQGPPGDESCLRRTLSEMLDSSGLPPTVLCIPPCLTQETSCLENGAAPEGQPSIGRFLALFDAILLDTPLLDLWTTEARRHATENMLVTPVSVHDTKWTPSEENVKVVMNLELDGAWVESTLSPGGWRWDTSKVIVLDGLVDECLRRDLLALIEKPDGNATTTDTTESRASNTPRPKWERTLVDVDCVTESRHREPEVGGAEHFGSADVARGSWGMTEEALRWLCQEGAHPALVEVQSRLQKLYPSFRICHMPEAVFGPGTPRMVANAPVYGDHYSWHVDADPTAVPPSPWRDHFGAYTNREPGMPLFATLLIYLDAEWEREYDGETLLLDAPTGTGVFVRPLGGRAVIMDQDVTHRISTPSQIAGRPRYSLVWKLVFFPDTSYAHQLVSASNVDGAVLSYPSVAQPGWGEPVRFGSALPPATMPPMMPSTADPVAVVSSSVDLRRLSPWPEQRQAGGHAQIDPLREEQDGQNCSESLPLSGPSGGIPLCERVPIGGLEAEVRCTDSERDPVHGLDPSGDLYASTSSASCTQNLEGEDNAVCVEVKPVGLKGMGVFAKRPISRGDVIGFYIGELLSTKELDKRYPNFEGSEFVMQVGSDAYLDAKDTSKSDFTRYLNHSGRAPNIVLELQPNVAKERGLGSNEVAFVATRDVNEGEELTFDYGEGFFEDEDAEGDVIEDGQEIRDMLRGVDWGGGAFSV